MVEMEGKRYTDTDRVYRRNTLAAVSLTGKRESNRQQISSKGEEQCPRARLSSSRARTAGHAKSVKRPHGHTVALFQRRRKRFDSSCLLEAKLARLVGRYAKCRSSGVVRVWVERRNDDG